MSETQNIASLHGLAHNNGFDLSLSFSLIAQSKAPLEKNIRANVMFDFGFFTIVYFSGVQEGFAVSEFRFRIC